MGSNDFKSDFGRLDSPPVLCPDETKKLPDEETSSKLAEKKIDLPHILPSGAFTSFHSNMYAVGWFMYIHIISSFELSHVMYK